MEIVLMNDNAIIPTRASKGSAKLDLYSSVDVDIEVDKFSLASKGLLALDGVIDSDYTGEIVVIMTPLIEPIKIKKGQKIAQLIVSNIIYPEIKKLII